MAADPNEKVKRFAELVEKAQGFSKANRYWISSISIAGYALFVGASYYIDHICKEEAAKNNRELSAKKAEAFRRYLLLAPEDDLERNAFARLGKLLEAGPVTEPEKEA